MTPRLMMILSSVAIVAGFTLAAGIYLGATMQAGMWMIGCGVIVGITGWFLLATSH